MGFINNLDERAGQMNCTKMDAQYNQKKGTTLLALAAGLALAVVVAATQGRDAPSLTASVVPTASSLPSSLQAEQAAVVYIVASEAQREALARLAYAELPAQPVILVEGDEAQALRYLAEIQAGVRVYDLR
jgi:hypothetical protein